jgi:hypothetical protein
MTTKPKVTKKRKCLVDTSAVRPAIGTSTTAHNDYFRNRFQNDSLTASVYIRMEVIRRWVCEFIRAALLVRMAGTVSNALYILEQDFGTRQCKATIAIIAATLGKFGSLSDTSGASEEIGRMAVLFLEMFDRAFPGWIENKSGCKIGSRGLDVDFNTLLVDLQTFYEHFRVPITDCKVNSFLQLAKPKGRSRQLLAGDGANKQEAVKNLSDFQSGDTHITCVECSQIGDAVIALECPHKFAIIHTDKAFEKLCLALGLTSLKISSVKAIHKATSPSPISGTSAPAAPAAPAAHAAPSPSPPASSP